MKQVQYNGYAQRTGFDPIKAPDQSARILAEGQRQLRGMQAVRSQMNENNQSQIAGLQRKHALEAQNREANFDLETGFREKYQQAVLQNYRTRLDDANKNVGDVEQITGSLVAFSNTLAKKFTEYQEKKGEAEELAGFNAVFEFGITNEELNAIQATSAQIDAVDTAVNSTIQGLQERGVSAEQIAQLRGLSGRRLVGAMKATALKGADDYPLFRAENQDTMFQVGDQEFSLNTARNAGPQVWAAVNAQLRTEYMKKFRGIDPKFLNEYLFKGMRETENQEKMSFANDRQKMLSQQFQEEQMNELMTDWKGDGPQGVWNWIQRTSGGTSIGLRNQRLAAISILEDAAKSGQFTATDFEALQGLPVTLNGSSKPQAFGELYGRDLVALENAITGFNRKEYEQDKFELQMQQDKAVKDLHDYVTKNGPLSEQEKEQYETWWRETFREHPPSEITKFTTSEEMADKEADRMLESKARVGQLTTLELMSGRYSTSLINKYRSFAKSGDSANEKFVSSIKRSVDQMIKEQQSGLATPTEQLNAEYYMMQARAHQDLDQRAAREMADGASPEAAYQKAAMDIQKEIKANSGQYALKTGADGKPLLNGGYQIFRTSGSALHEQQRVKQVRNRMYQISQNGGNPFQQPGLLNAAELKQIEAAGKGGAIPALVYQMNKSYPKLTPYEIMDMIMEAEGKPAITRPPAAAVYDGVRPEFRSLMTYRPSLARTARAYAQTGGPTTPYAGLLNLIASKESSNDTVNGGYDSLNTGGSAGGHVAHGSGTGLAKFGRPLTEMTVGEVMDLQARNVLHATGRYQIIGSTLAGLVANGKASRSDLYDQVTQDRLAIALIHGRAGKFFSGEVGASNVIKGMGQEWIGLQNVKPQQLVAALEAAKSNLNNPNFDPSRMKSSIIYKVGGIGPKGPGQYGPHLDIKQSTGKFFERASLDTYLGFDDGRGGVLPVSAGVTVDGGQFGAPRNYGSHNGWDYAMPAGTKVILRNGAWVAGRVKTDYGDRLTIALPDGRRFNIIHGTAV